MTPSKPAKGLGAAAPWSGRGTSSPEAATPLDAIEATIIILEDRSVFDALWLASQSDGQVECDAIVMDAATLRAGSVAGLHRVKESIALARPVLEKCPHMDADLRGTERFAAQHGITLCDPPNLISPAEREAWPSLQQRFPRPPAITGPRARHRPGLSPGCTRPASLPPLPRGTCCKLPGRVGERRSLAAVAIADAETGGVSSHRLRREAIMKIVFQNGHRLFASRRFITSSAQAAVQLLAKRARAPPA